VSDPISDPERARRLARVLFSDLVAYAGDEVRIGLEKDDLLERLHADIERAREYYRLRVDPGIADAERIFDFALVDVLVGAQRKVSTPIW
jgi:hypothetical protein